MWTQIKGAVWSGSTTFDQEAPKALHDTTDDFSCDKRVQGYLLKLCHIYYISVYITMTLGQVVVGMIFEFCITKHVSKCIHIYKTRK